SSRVGTRTRARGADGRCLAPDLANAITVGTAKATVLPLPVLPLPSTSRPASELGRVAAWIGNGVGQPAPSSDRMMAASTPSWPKVVSSGGASTTSYWGLGTEGPALAVVPP